MESYHLTHSESHTLARKIALAKRKSENKYTYIRWISSTDIFEKIHRRVHTIFSFRHLTHIPLMSLLITAIRSRRL